MGTSSKKLGGGVSLDVVVVAENDPQVEVPDHALWTQETVELLRRVIHQHETELADLRAQLHAAESRLASGCN